MSSSERPIGESLRMSSALDVLADQALGGSQEEDSSDTSENEGSDNEMVVERNESSPPERIRTASLPPDVTVPNVTVPLNPPDSITMDVDEPVQGRERANSGSKRAKCSQCT